MRSQLQVREYRGCYAKGRLLTPHGLANLWSVRSVDRPSMESHASMTLTRLSTAL